MDELEWDKLEGVEASERILRAAIGGKAHEIHLSCDSDGSSVFFVSQNHIEFFHHIPARCTDSVRRYLRSIATIDTWEKPPTKGFGIFRWDGDTYNLEVQIAKGSVDEDVIVCIAELADPDSGLFDGHREG